MNIKNPKKGQLLIAEPSIIGDESFSRTIILLAEHGVNGSLGFILNKPSDYILPDLIPELHTEFIIYIGGPVENDKLYFIHKVPNLIPDSIEISDGLYWGGAFNTACKLINSNVITAHDIKFFIGYTGWQHLQLEHEISNNSWVITNNSYQKKLLSKNYNSFWKEKMLDLGGEYNNWSNAPENPMHN